MKMISINEWRVLRESDEYFDTVTIDTIRSDPEQKKALDRALYLANKGNVAVVARYFADPNFDPFELYHRSTRAPLPKDKVSDYRKATEATRQNLKLFGNKFEATSGAPFEHVNLNYEQNPEIAKSMLPPEMRDMPPEKIKQFLDKDFRQSQKKLYFQYDVMHPRAVEAHRALLQYYLDNPTDFREAKYIVNPETHRTNPEMRKESFIYYMSKFGDPKAEMHQAKIQQLIKSFGLDAKSSSGVDEGEGSGNQIKAMRKHQELLVPLLDKELLQNLVDIGAKAEKGGKITTNTEYNALSFVKEIRKNPKLQKMIQDKGVKLEGSDQPPGSASDQRGQPSQPGAPKAPGKGNLVLTPEGAPPMEIRVPLGVGSRIIRTPLAQRFMSGIQFNVVKRGNNWVISHHPEATNITRLNGQPLSQPMPLSDGDVISLGKTGQVPIKVGFKK